MARLKIVRVDWVDAVGGVRLGWRPVSKCKADNTTLCVSIGVLIERTKEAIVVLPHICHIASSGVPEWAQGDGEIAIPSSWVKRVKVLGYI
jgi:hypothetical protein